MFFKKEGKIHGDNTDVYGFQCALQHINYNIKNKKAFILGSGGVVPSIISALKKMGISDIVLSNRTQKKIENLKAFFINIESIEWGKTIDFDVIINATSIGLKANDKFKIDYSEGKSDKFFYDVIYNPKKTSFLK